MTESDRVTVLETKVVALEARMKKVENIEENKSSTLFALDTRLQLFGQKFDTLVDSIRTSEESKKFNWTQVVAVLAILAGLGGTVWATSYTIEKTISAQPNPSTVLQMSEEDIQLLTEAVLYSITDSKYKFEEENK